SAETLQAMAGATLGVLPFPDRREMEPVQAVTGVEYLALGKPMVGTRLPGTATLIEHGANGLLVEPGDAEGMADAIASIISDPRTAKAMGEAALARAPAFDVSKVDARLVGALSS
ncbi:MAG TPA: glycosyltransferase, partial [Acidimicrobiales bacterium]|nr:glycosyltransferase [Acidimicrobiales bacterium]